MDWLTPGLGSLISGGIQAATGLFGGMLGQSGQAATNAQQMSMFNQSMNFNHNERIDAQNFSKEMAETQYQRTVTDMRKAGLNPILALGFGGSSPSSSGASIGTGPSLGNPGSSMQAGLTSAGQAAAVAAQTKVALTQADKDSSQTDLNKASEDLAKKQGVRTDQDTATAKSAEELNKAATIRTHAESMNKVFEGELMKANANSANAVARVNTRIAEDTERFGDSQWSKAIGGVLRILQTGQREIPNSAQVFQKFGMPDPRAGVSNWNLGAFKPAGSDNPVVQERLRRRNPSYDPTSP